jgi:hypothetical protein
MKTRRSSYFSVIAHVAALEYVLAERAQAPLDCS